MRFPGILLLLAILVAASCESTPTADEPTVSTSVGPVASVTVTPASFTLFVGGNTQLSAVAKDAAGSVIAPVTIDWSSSDLSKASISSGGSVAALGVGAVTITATVSGVSGSAAISVQAPPTGSGDVVVNAGVTHQTMRGWEAFAQAFHEDAAYPQFRDELMDRAVNELGINRVRLPMVSGIEQDTDYYAQLSSGQIGYDVWRCARPSARNDNNDPFNINWGGFHFSMLDGDVDRIVLPLRQRLQARGEDVHINLQYRGGSQNGQCSGYPYVHDDDPEEFAEFVLANFIHLRDKYGIVPQSFELMNEPNNGRWATKGQLLGASLVATMRRLNANGFNPRVIAPSMAFVKLVLPYLDDMGKTPGALQLIDEVSYHRYDGPNAAALQAIRNRAAQLGAETSMLEWIKADQGTLYQDIVNGGTSAWQQFALAWSPPDDGGAYYVIDTAKPANQRVVLSSRARYLSQYFKYVRDGAQRIGATSTMGGVAPVAFVNSTGKMVMVANIMGSKTFTVGGLAAGTYDITFTTSAVLQADGGTRTIAAGQPISVSVPASGVVTLAAR